MTSIHEFPAAVLGVIPADVPLSSTTVPEAMQRVHQALLNGLVAVRDYLDCYGIEYWMDAGTLLGAHREGDLLAWDDDVDLGMTLQSFRQLERLASRRPPAGLTWTSPINDPTQPSFIPGKFRINGTYALDQAWVSHVGPAPRSLGLSIDIFPFERIPRMALLNRVTRRLGYEIYLRETYRNPRIAARHHKDEFHAAMVSRVPQRLIDAATDLLRAAGSGSELWGYGIDTPWHQLRLTRDQIWPLSTQRLGKLHLPAPADTEAYLSQLYGPDFLTPPPIHRRATHSVLVGFRDE